MPSSHSWMYFWNRAWSPPTKKKSVLPCACMIIRPEPLENNHLPIILSMIQKHIPPIIAVLTVCCTSRGLTFIFNSHSVSSKCQNVIYSYPRLWGQPVYQSRMGCVCVMEEAAKSFLTQPDEEQEESWHEHPPGGSVWPVLSLSTALPSQAYKWEKGLSCSSCTSNDILSSSKSCRRNKLWCWVNWLVMAIILAL